MKLRKKSFSILTADLTGFDELFIFFIAINSSKSYLCMI